MSDQRENREKGTRSRVAGPFGVGRRSEMDRGLGADEARYAAQREFGNTTLVKEVTREMWGWSYLERFLQNVRYGLRLIGRNPGFTAVAILTLALALERTQRFFPW